jgi:hypothetical protein
MPSRRSTRAQGAARRVDGADDAGLGGEPDAPVEVGQRGDDLVGQADGAREVEVGLLGERIAAQRHDEHVARRGTGAAEPTICPRRRSW